MAVLTICLDQLGKTSGCLRDKCLTNIWSLLGVFVCVQYFVRATLVINSISFNNIFIFISTLVSFIGLVLTLFTPFKSPEQQSLQLVCFFSFHLFCRTGFFYQIRIKVWIVQSVSLGVWIISFQSMFPLETIAGLKSDCLFQCCH